MLLLKQLLFVVAVVVNDDIAAVVVAVAVAVAAVVVAVAVVVVAVVVSVETKLELSKTMRRLMPEMSVHEVARMGRLG